MMTLLNFDEGLTTLADGNIVAVPAESSYGLSCRVDCPQAIEQIYRLKGRPVEKGLIICARDWSAIADWVETAGIPVSHLQRMHNSWPGPVTWIIPARVDNPLSRAGLQATTLAVRISAHPLLAGLSAKLGQALISTSANPSGYPPATTPEQVAHYFPQGIHGIIAQDKPADQPPTRIIDLATLKIIRP